MKRREDDDKFMGRPMFPRLHINDTEKGGPRAPPRNKMALYEQLTIPSQSHNSGGAVPPTLNPNNNINLVPFNSRNQGMDSERRMHLPLYQSPLALSYSHDELQGTEVVNLSNQPAQMQNRMKPVEEDELVVPIFSHHEIGSCTGTTQNIGDEERSTQQRAHNPTMVLSNGSNKTNHNTSGKLVSMQRRISQGRDNLRVSDAPQRHSEVSKRERDSVQRVQQDKCILSGSEVTEICLHRDLGSGLPAMETRFGEVASDQPLESTTKDISLRLKHNPCVGYACNDANGFDNGIRTIDDYSVETENVDGDDDMSETSMLDSASALDISADDVVGIMGVKNFLRARSAIANHQRVLAAQVFELHRLMKVQGLIADLPHLLLEDSDFMGNTSLKDSNVKKYSSELAVKALAHTTKDGAQEPRDKLERTAENAVSKPPPALVPKSSPPVNTEPNMNPWCFHQPPSHQWLVPVMCPSQGLVYKPCSSPGLMGPAFGGHGPLGPTPMVSNSMNPAYGIGMPLGIHYSGQGYFPPYGMPIISPNLSGPVMDQMNQFSSHDPCAQIARPAGGSTKSSCNGPIQKNGATMPGAKDGEFQRSTASSRSEQARGSETADLTKGRDAFPLFPVSTVTEISLGVPSTQKPSRVIRVVPRDRGSTRESAARIFQSIQEERRQQGSN